MILKRAGFFNEELRKQLDPGIEVVEVDANMEAPEFGDIASKSSLEIFNGNV